MNEVQWGDRVRGTSATEEKRVSALLFVGPVMVTILDIIFLTHKWVIDYQKCKKKRC